MSRGSGCLNGQPHRLLSAPGEGNPRRWDSTAARPRQIVVSFCCDFASTLFIIKKKGVRSKAPGSVADREPKWKHSITRFHNMWTEQIYVIEQAPLLRAV